MPAYADYPHPHDPSVLREEVELAEREAASERQLRGLGALAQS